MQALWSRSSCKTKADAESEIPAEEVWEMVSCQAAGLSPSERRDATGVPLGSALQA